MFTKEHYKAIAEVIKNRLVANSAPNTDPGIKGHNAMLSRNEDIRIALDLAKLFAKDNERFDPKKFLNACSPDAFVYPLSKLWEPT